MKRQIIIIDQEKCNGCGLCVSDCPEGALRIIDGKARLVGDLLCDGLGACMKSCPEDAISVEEREAEPYDEIRVLENIVPQGRNVLQAHLEHLRNHGQSAYLQQAMTYLGEHRIAVDLPQESAPCQTSGRQCPGSQSQTFVAPPDDEEDGSTRPSRLTHWPIQLHLISPAAPHFRNSDLLVAADCAAFSYGDFHKDFLKGKTLTIACPKLDSGQEVYQRKTDSPDRSGRTQIDQRRDHAGPLLQRAPQDCRGRSQPRQTTDPRPLRGGGTSRRNPARVGSSDWSEKG